LFYGDSGKLFSEAVKLGSSDRGEVVGQVSTVLY